MSEKHKPLHLNIVNRKASFEYAFLAKYTAGIQLAGTEVKSVKAGNVNISEAYCVFESGGLFLKNMHISEFKSGGHYNHEPLRARKLLLKKSELEKIKERIKEKGLTLIPIKVFLSDTGFIKTEIAIAKGKKMFDKREDVKERDVERQLKRREYE